MKFLSKAECSQVVRHTSVFFGSVTYYVCWRCEGKIKVGGLLKDTLSEEERLEDVESLEREGLLCSRCDRRVAEEKGRWMVGRLCHRCTRVLGRYVISYVVLAVLAIAVLALVGAEWRAAGSGTEERIGLVCVLCAVSWRIHSRITTE